MTISVNGGRLGLGTPGRHAAPWTPSPPSRHGADDLAGARRGRTAKASGSWSWRRMVTSRLFLPGAVLTILAAVSWGFVSVVVLFGDLAHYRAQQTGYAQLRGQLANSVAPVGPTDLHGRLLPLGAPVAVLDVPAIGVHEVVFEGTTGGVLEKGPGHRRDTALPGQAGVSVVMGRQAAYSGPFSDLSRLHGGDTISVVTGQGKQVFRVIDQRRAGDRQPPPLDQGKARLTLVTGTGSPFMPSGVLRVDADAVSQAQPPAALALPAGSLPLSEQAMATDPTAWTPLVLTALPLVGTALCLTWLSVRWGRWQAWVVGVPLLAALGMAVADQASRLLPNLT